MEIHTHNGTYMTVTQWNQIFLSKLTACTQQQFSLSSHTMKEEWFLSLSTSSLGLPHYAQPLPVSSMCPSLQVPCILVYLVSPYWHHCMHSLLCLSQKKRENRTLCSLGFQNTAPGPHKPALFQP